MYIYGGETYQMYWEELNYFRNDNPKIPFRPPMDIDLILWAPARSVFFFLMFEYLNLSKFNFSRDWECPELERCCAEIIDAINNIKNVRMFVSYVQNIIYCHFFFLNL